MANWMNRSARFASRWFLNHLSPSKSLTSAPILHRIGDVSKDSIWRTPLRPAFRFSQSVARSWPIEVTTPSPVTTTLRCMVCEVVPSGDRPGRNLIKPDSPGSSWKANAIERGQSHTATGPAALGDSSKSSTRVRGMAVRCPARSKTRTYPESFGKQIPADPATRIARPSLVRTPDGTPRNNAASNRFLVTPSRQAESLEMQTDPDTIPTIGAAKPPWAWGWPRPHPSHAT